MKTTATAPSSEATSDEKPRYDQPDPDREALAKEVIDLAAKADEQVDAEASFKEYFDQHWRSVYDLRFKFPPAGSKERTLVAGKLWTWSSFCTAHFKPYVLARMPAGAADVAHIQRTITAEHQP